MKDYQIQTPKKYDHHPPPPRAANRRSKSISYFTNKTHQISKKCSDSASTSIAEDASLESPSIELSPISQISDDLTPLTTSTITTTEQEQEQEQDEPNNNLSVSHSRSHESKTSDEIDIVSVEADLVANYLNLARTKLMNSTDVDVGSRKILDALIKLVIEEFDGLEEEKDRFAELVSKKRSIVFLSVLLWILVVLVIFLFRSGEGRRSFSEPPPT